MARSVYRFDKTLGKVVEVNSDYTPEPRVHIIEDSLPTGGLWHPATRNTYVSSKSKFREMTKAAGCVEVGNEPQVDRRNWKVPGLKEDIRQVIDMLKSR